MGEDFLRRRNDRFIRQRDARFMQLIERDLFTALPPETITTTIGWVLAAVEPANELWCHKAQAGTGLRFFKGDQLAIEVAAADAASLVELYGSETPLVAEVVEVDSEEGLAFLRVRSANEA